MKKGYWISLYLKIDNQENLKRYAETVTPIIKGFGGIPLVRGGEYQTFDGDNFIRTVIWEFPSYKKAIELKPDFANAHSNLGTLLKDMGRLSESCSALIQAINLNPYFSDAYANLGIAIKNIKFNSSNVKLYPILIQLLTRGNFARPEDLAGSICSLLKHDPLIKNLLFKENFPSNIEKVNLMINSLDNLKLLHHLMRVCPLPDLQFESLFVKIRSFLLSNLDDIEETPEFIYFLSTLSLHCFTNEYVYIEKDKETKLIEGLETEIMQTIEQTNQPEIKKILCLASYRPLHQYKWCKKLNCLDNIEEVKLRLIEEPNAEREIVKEIPVLEEIKPIRYTIRFQ